MHIGDIYRHKKYNKFIRITGFAKDMKTLDTEGFIIVYEVLQEIDYYLGSCPSFMEYAYNEEQIEKEYDLYISQDNINYENFDKINQDILKELRRNK